MSVVGITCTKARVGVPEELIFQLLLLLLHSKHFTVTFNNNNKNTHSNSAHDDDDVDIVKRVLPSNLLVYCKINKFFSVLNDFFHV